MRASMITSIAHEPDFFARPRTPQIYHMSFQFEQRSIA